MKRRALHRALLPAALIALVAPAIALADPQSQPTTQPTSATTAAQPPARVRIKVLVVPFRQIDPSASNTWIADAVREAVRGDLARARNLEVVETPPALVPLASDAAAISAARRLEAAYVLSGTYQVIDGRVRLISQLYDAPTGDVIGSYKQTADIGSLFEMQDDLASQTRETLAKTLAAKSPDPDTSPAAADLLTTATGPLRITSPLAPKKNPYLEPYEDQHSTMSRQKYFYNSGPSNTSYYYGAYFGTGYYSRGYGWGGRVSAYPYFGASGGAASKYGAATP